MRAFGWWQSSNRFAIGIAVAVLYGANLLLLWPGSLTPDSTAQLSQAVSGVYTDWHPPFMAMLWRLIGAAPSHILILQVSLHWLGIWAFAERVRQVHPTRWVWLVIATGFTPIALKYTGVIQKDSLLTSFLILAFGLSFLTGRAAYAAPFGIAAALCRANGVFALPPLLFSLRRRPRLASMIAVSIVVAVVMVPVLGFFNTRILGAEASGVQRSLQLFDMAGIAHYTGDASELPEGAKDAARCYTPLFWDPLGKCVVPLPKMKLSLTSEWLRSILHHPVAYAEHRIAHFNRTIFFLVPPMQQCVDAPTYHQCDFTARGKLRDVLQKNALLWPVTWLIAGLMLLFGKLSPISRALTLSGLLYGGAYIIVGVAADFRYFYWTEVAVQLAVALQLALTGRVDRGKLVLSGVGVIWLTGYAARIALGQL